MTIELKTMSRQDLEKLRRDVDRTIATIGERERKAALDAAERVVAEHGFTLSELTEMVGRTAKSSKPKSPAKFRNPADPEMTWSGRGRKPAWIKDAETEGRPMSDFAV